MLKLVAISALAVGLAAPGAASADELPRRITIGGDELRLNGVGVYEASLFNVDVFEAGLYLARPTASASRALTSAQTRCLVLRFKRDVSRKKLVKVAEHALVEPRGRGRARPVARPVAEFLESLPSASDGDVLTFIHHPRRGLAIAHNGEHLLRAENDDLARSIFASWIGPGAVDADLSRDLLGQ